MMMMMMMWFKMCFSFGNLFVTFLLVSTEINPCWIATGTLPQVRLMELRQVVKRSQTASVLQAIASPEVYKHIWKIRVWRALMLLQFAQISITFIALPPTFHRLSPTHLFFILTSSSKGHQPVCYSQAEANNHQRPIGSALVPVTSPRSNPVAEGRTWGNGGVKRW